MPWSDRDMHTVVLGALVADGRVLLALRSSRKQANPGVWDLPGGVVEAGESEFAALSRELSEELGVRIGPSAASHLARVVAQPADAPVQISAWLIETWHGTPVNVAQDEHDDVAWFDVDQMPPLAHEAVHEALVKAVSGRSTFD